MSADIVKIGTSGYSYPDWIGPFYPENLPQCQFLEYYASHFDTLELNYTFYQYPHTGSLEKMVNRTRGEMMFWVKAHQSFTHDFGDTGEFKKFIHMLDPFINAKVLAGVLLQFPWSFKQTPETQSRLESLCDVLGSIKGCVEFRHKSWMHPEILSWLKTRNLSFCSLDQPRLRDLPGVVCDSAAAPGYIRFHGRNHAQWWDHTDGWQRYDYLYSPAELREWVSRVKHLREMNQTVYVFFNNHYRGQAVKNAQMLTAFLVE